MNRGPDELFSEPLIAVNAPYVLSKLEEHTRECTQRWQILILTVIGGFGALTLAFLGLIFAILEHKP